MICWWNKCRCWKVLGAVAKSGNESGYKNYKNGTIGDFKFQEFSANPKELKNITTEKVTSGDTTSWTEYPPEMATVGMVNDDSVVNMRRVTFVIVYYLMFLSFCSIILGLL